jgi:hypothetical protein
LIYVYFPLFTKLAVMALCFGVFLSHSDSVMLIWRRFSFTGRGRPLCIIPCTNRYRDRKWACFKLPHLKEFKASDWFKPTRWGISGFKLTTFTTRPRMLPWSGNKTWQCAWCVLFYITRTKDILYWWGKVNNVEVWKYFGYNHIADIIRYIILRTRNFNTSNSSSKSRMRISMGLSFFLIYNSG